MDAITPLTIHWVRHGSIASHRGDMPLTAEGQKQAEMFGQQLSKELVPGEQVFFLYAPTRRARETAEGIYTSLNAAFEHMTNGQAQLFPPVEHQAIRNPDIYVAGTRIELVSSPEALAEQLLHIQLSPEQLLQLPFLASFWKHPDRIGYWVNHPDPPGENADTVARRLLTFATSLLDSPSNQSRRYICATHSPTLRAFLRRYLLGHDPGEPQYLEAVNLRFALDRTLTISFHENTKIIT